MTSGAIQHGVPTNVFRTLFLVMSPPVARKALTPKSRMFVECNCEWNREKKDKQIRLSLAHLDTASEFKYRMWLYIILRYRNREGDEKTLYQQFALSHHPQAECFQPSDPCAWRHRGLKHDNQHFTSEWLNQQGSDKAANEQTLNAPAYKQVKGAPLICITQVHMISICI